VPFFDHSKEVFLIGNIHSHEDSAIEKIGVKDINRQINLLGEEYQTPFEMHFQGFKYKEIADKTRYSDRNREKPDFHRQKKN
jgi:DNA-directed RNA polymerase specialized sigma24 family protein